MRRIADRKGEVVEPARDKEYTDEHTDRAALILALDGWVAGLPPRVTGVAASAG